MVTKKEEAIRLRVEERKSFDEIMAILGTARSTLHHWLKGYPLTTDELQSRATANHAGGRPKQNQGQPSQFYQMATGCSITSVDHGRIAEAAVVFRLALHGIKIYRSAFDGDEIDLAVEPPNKNKIYKIQIKAARHREHGLPIFSVCTSYGRQPYCRDNCDFLVGYDLYHDTAYVYTFDEIKHVARSITSRHDCAERWDKILAGE